MSVDYYDRNARAFFDDTVRADMDAARSRFLAHLPLRGCVLDAGCGSGRDVAAFAALGYEVTAFDASAEMVRLASAFTGLPVRQMTFNEMAWSERFEGIWASASLIHVVRAELPAVMARFRGALKAGGAWYLSFKHGTGERERDGRRFTDMDGPLLRAEVGRLGGLKIADMWVSADARPKRADEEWLNAILRRDGA